MSSRTSRMSTLALLSIAAINLASAATIPTPLAATCSPDSQYFDRVNCPNGCQCFSKLTSGAPVCMYSFDYSKPCTTDAGCLQYGSFYSLCLTASFAGSGGYCASNDPNNWHGGQNVACAKGRPAPTSSIVSSTTTVGSTSSSVTSSASSGTSSSSSFFESSSEDAGPSGPFKRVSSSASASSATPTSSVVSASSPVVSSSGSSAFAGFTTPTSSLSPLSPSALPSPSAASNILTCVGIDTGATFKYTTSQGAYDITCGADFPGGDLKFLYTDSFDACVAACDEETTCLTVAFRSGACYLKNQMTDSRSDLGVWAARKHEAVVKASSSGPTCIDKASDATTYKSSNGKSYNIICGKEYGGGDLTSVSTNSFTECIETCSATAGCIDVSYVNGACYLKNAKSSLIDAGHVWTAELSDSAKPVSTAPAISELSCLDSKDDKKSYTAANGGIYVIECGVDYVGNDLNAVDSSSFNACMDACDTTTGCVDVSYVWGRCYLKSTITSSSPVGHVWTGRRPSSAPTEAEALSALKADGGSFCKSYIGYVAPTVTTVTTQIPVASTVLSIKTEKSTAISYSTTYVTNQVVQTLSMLQPRQALPTPSAILQWPGSRVSSICSLVATGTSTKVSTTTASAARTTLVSTFTTVVSVTKPTTVVSVVTSTTRALNPTAAVNLDFETGDSYNWNSIVSDPLWSNSIVSPGHSRPGVTSNFAAQISRDVGVTQTYAFSRYDQLIPDMTPDTTYRYEFSFKYANDSSVADDACEFTVGLWGIGIATIVPSTTSTRLSTVNSIQTVPKCGGSSTFKNSVLPSQPAGEWRRYTGYYRYPSYVGTFPKMVWIGFQCQAGAQKVKQTIWFDDVVVAPEAAC